MTQTTGRFFDELGKLITDAAGAASGVRKEIESVVRSQAEHILRELDVVQREEFEAVKAMAQKAREENEQLKAAHRFARGGARRYRRRKIGAAYAPPDPAPQAEAVLLTGSRASANRSQSPALRRTIHSLSLLRPQLFESAAASPVGVRRNSDI